MDNIAQLKLHPGIVTKRDISPSVMIVQVEVGDLMPVKPGKVLLQ
jgi:hypothetical protein